MIACKVENCPFFDKGVCRSKTTCIDERGMCQQIWRKGVRRPDCFDPVDEKFKKDVVTIDVERLKATETA